MKRTRPATPSRAAMRSNRARLVLAEHIQPSFLQNRSGQRRQPLKQPVETLGDKSRANEKQ